MHRTSHALAPVSGPAERPEQVQAGPGAGLDAHLASLLSPHSFEADQYRVLRRLLNQAREATRLKVLAVSSPAAGDGKTTTTINLAATLAQVPGCRALLVDTDLRRPVVAAKLGLEPSGPGLVGAVLDEGLDQAGVVRPTPYGLAILPAGLAPANPCQVLESPRFGQLLDQARRSYDYVVLDTPPALLVPDCRLMSRWVDAFLLVVAAHRTPRILLAEALSAMEPAKLLGIVFNGDDRPLSRYYKRHYGSYYHQRPPSLRGDGGWRFWVRHDRTRPSARASK